MIETFFCLELLDFLLVNLPGYVSVKTTALAKDSLVTRMTKLVEEAHKKKSQTQRFIDDCAKYYIPSKSLPFLFAISVSNRCFTCYNFPEVSKSQP